MPDTNPQDEFADPVIDAMEKECAVLESIFEKYPIDSIERQIGKKAAFALVFTTLHHHEEFQTYLASISKPLSDEEIVKLAKFTSASSDPTDI